MSLAACFCQLLCMTSYIIFATYIFLKHRLHLFIYSEVFMCNKSCLIVVKEGGNDYIESSILRG